jgi:hypothetical protein
MQIDVRSQQAGRTGKGRRSGIVPLFAALSIWVGCAAKFDGPFPCEPGYASCGSSQNCETDLLHDAQNCGACGVACAVGATCSSSACGNAATTIYSFQSAGYAPSQLTVNSTALFWASQNGPSNIYRLPLSGGTPQAILQNGSAGGQNMFSVLCGGFAVDDDYLYFLGSFYGNAGSSTGLGRLSFADGSVTELVASPQTTGPSCPQSMAISGGYVYGFVSQGGNGVGLQVWSAPVDGSGPFNMVFNQPSSNNGSNQVVLAGQQIVFEQSNSNGPLELAVVPLGGGKATPLTNGQSNGPGYGLEAFTADANNAYAGSTGCPCNDNGAESSGAPTGVVTIVPLGGGNIHNLANITGYLGAMGVDASNLYVLTDSTLWRVPLAGGAALPIAGNLTGGTAPVNCQNNSCSGYNGSGSVPQAGDLVVGSNAVYLFDRSAGVYSILAVPN